MAKEEEFRVTAAPLPDELVPCLQHPVSQKVKSLHTIDKGMLTIAASVKDTHVGRGNAIELSLSCRNESLVDIQRVEIKVTEVVVSEGKYFKEHAFIEKNATINGFPCKATNEQNVKEAERRSATERQRQHAEMYGEIMNDTYIFSFACPSSVRDSYKGKLFQVNHHVKIKLTTNAMTDNPSIMIPLRIGNPPPSHGHLTADPSSLPTQTSARSTVPLSSLVPIPIPPPNEVAGPEVTHPELADQMIVFSVSLPELHANPPSVPTAMAMSSTSALLDDTLPAATAVPIDAMDAPTTVVQANAILVGGEVTTIEEDSLDSGRSFYDNLVPLPPPPSTAPSLPNLCEEMLVSVEDYEIIQNKFHDMKWRTLLEGISADEFGTIIGHVNVDSDQPRVATLLASAINDGNINIFTCQYCVAALKNASQWIRPKMVEVLVPFCIDLAENQNLIQANLSEWEQLITAPSMRNAL